MRLTAVPPNHSMQKDERPAQHIELITRNVLNTFIE